jgi:hypothetical protein
MSAPATARRKPATIPPAPPALTRHEAMTETEFHHTISPTRCAVGRRTGPTITTPKDDPQFFELSVRMQDGGYSTITPSALTGWHALSRCPHAPKPDTASAAMHRPEKGLQRDEQGRDLSPRTGKPLPGTRPGQVPTAAEKAKAARAGTTPPPPRNKKSPCKCGCGKQVTNLFAQGHDARLVSQLAQQYRETRPGGASATAAKKRASLRDALLKQVNFSEPLARKLTRSLEIIEKRATAPAK